MFNKLLFLLCAAVSMTACHLFAEGPATRSTIRWLTDYEEAVQQSKSGSKPLLLFFTGSDWCGWCTKLDEEALDAPEFAEAVGNKFIFVKLDFPLYATQDPQLKSQNKQLQQKFDVRSFPTVILVDPQQNQQIGVTGYRPGGGKPFADHLLKMVNDYSAYKQKVSALDKAKLSGGDLKQLYDKSKELGLYHDTGKIVKKGIGSDESLYFLTERYRYLAGQGRMNEKGALALRQQLLAADPANEKQIHYQVALIEFETYCSELEKGNCTPETAISPLVAYIKEFGAQDKDNLWRLQLIISQVYLDKNELTSALKYAQSSYEAAPTCVQPELSRAITSIRSQLHSAR